MQQSKNKSLLASHDILVFFSVHWILQSFSGPREDVQDRVGRGCSRWKVQLHHETVQRKICTQPQLDFRYMYTCTHVCGNGSKWKNVELKIKKKLLVFNLFHWINHIILFELQALIFKQRFWKLTEEPLPCNCGIPLVKRGNSQPLR